MERKSAKPMQPRGRFKNVIHGVASDVGYKANKGAGLKVAFALKHNGKGYPVER
jgi:hypothetical protein